MVVASASSSVSLATSALSRLYSSASQNTFWLSTRSCCTSRRSRATSASSSPAAAAPDGPGASPAAPALGSSSRPCEALPAVVPAPSSGAAGLAALGAAGDALQVAVRAPGARVPAAAAVVAAGCAEEEEEEEGRVVRAVAPCLLGGRADPGRLLVPDLAASSSLMSTWISGGTGTSAHTHTQRVLLRVPPRSALGHWGGEAWAGVLRSACSLWSRKTHLCQAHELPDDFVRRRVPEHLGGQCRARRRRQCSLRHTPPPPHRRHVRHSAHSAPHVACQAVSARTRCEASPGTTPPDHHCPFAPSRQRPLLRPSPAQRRWPPAPAPSAARCRS